MLHIYRVPYADPDCPKEEREYRMRSGGPVGTLEDFKTITDYEIKVWELCPKCEEHYCDEPALSRRDNKTEICSNCGIVEALEDLRK